MELIITTKKGEQFTVLYDECDHELVAKYKWHRAAHGYVRGRAIIDPSGHPILMHRLFLGLQNNDGVFADHKNWNRLDNRRENIRVCTVGENNLNHRIRRDNKSGYKGVYWHKRDEKFVSCVRLCRQVFSLGYFDCPIEAAKAYDKKAKELHGEFAYLNFPDIAK